jgi:hypothetical protein
MINLNDWDLVDDDGNYIPNDFPELVGRATPFQSDNITAHFDDLEVALIQYIKKADVVLGCVAWLTSHSILEALAARNASILIQKEDFLRPDPTQHLGWKEKLQELYSRVSCKHIERSDLIGLGCHLSTMSEPSLQGIRCIGIAGTARARPRMHHKFLVFCRSWKANRDNLPEDIGHQVDVLEDQIACHVLSVSPYFRDEWLETHEMAEEQLRKLAHQYPDIRAGATCLKPYAIWTGSFNFSKMATQSMENALYIEDEQLAKRYMGEYAYALALSEPLDWSSEYCEPEYRLGT